MNKGAIAFVSLATSLLLSCAPHIRGVVVDTDGPIAGVKVVLKDTGKSLTTKENGDFNFTYSPGDVTVTLTKDGYVNITNKLGVKSGEIDLDKIQMTAFPKEPVSNDQILSILADKDVGFLLTLQQLSDQVVKIASEEIDKDSGLQTVAGNVWGSHEIFGRIARLGHPFSIVLGIKDGNWVSNTASINEYAEATDSEPVRLME